jgi:hypothetical protein
MDGLVINNRELYIRCVDQLIYFSLSSTTLLVNILLDFLSIKVRRADDAAYRTR